MSKQTLRMSGLMAALVLLGACQGKPIKACEDESKAQMSDGKIRRVTSHAVMDRTENGALKGTAPTGKDRPNKLLLVLDYSGSMYGGYGKAQDPSCATTCKADGTKRQGQPYYFKVPEFKQLLGQWLDAATPKGSSMTMEVLLFNAKVWRLTDTGVEEYTGDRPLTFKQPVSTSTASQLVTWLDRIPENPTKATGAAVKSTESKKALEVAVKALKNEGIVWLLTDNIVDTGSGVVSAEDAMRNLDFYTALSKTPQIQMINAFPIHLADRCSWMCGTSMFAYGMYVSKHERPDNEEFHRLGGTTARGGGPTDTGLLWNGALQKVAARYSGAASGKASKEVKQLAGVPLRLKPVDTEVLHLEFVLNGGQVLRCDRSAQFGDDLICFAKVKVRNMLRHQVVDRAELTFSNRVMLPRKQGEATRLPWVSAVCKKNVKMMTWQLGKQKGSAGQAIQVGPLNPLQEKVVEVLFKIPAVTVAHQKVGQLLDLATTDAILLDGHLEAEVQDISTRLLIDVKRAASVYGAQDLPKIFRRPEHSKIRAVYPAGALIGNDGQMLALLLLAGCGSLGLLVILLVMRMQRVQYTFLVDGKEVDRVSMPRISRRPVIVEGETRATVQRGWGRSVRVLPARGFSAEKDTEGWKLIRRGAGGGGARLEVRRGWSATASSSRATTSAGGDDF